jgi:hypothetical protein
MSTRAKIVSFIAIVAIAAAVWMVAGFRGTPVAEEQLQGAMGGAAKGSFGQMDIEPLVIWDISGRGIAGPIHQHLAVYSSGLVSRSAVSLAGTSAAMGQVTPGRAAQLDEELMVAGAMELADREGSVHDLPVTTVTVFNGSGVGALHNTFSFYATGEPGGYQGVVDILEWFSHEVFDCPDCQ